MNIKGFSTLQIQTPVSAVTDKQIKSDQTHDRDAQGQYFSQKQKKNQAMSDEQFDLALKKLNQKTFMIEMNWTANKIIRNEIKYAEVRNQSNDIIRCISEYDMWELFSDESPVEKSKGQLLKTVA